MGINPFILCFSIQFRPMTLDMIRNKVDPNSPSRYTDVESFISDVRLMFNNAYLFYRVSIQRMRFFFDEIKFSEQIYRRTQKSIQTPVIWNDSSKSNWLSGYRIVPVNILRAALLPDSKQWHQNGHATTTICHCLLVTMMMLYLPNIRLCRFFQTMKSRMTTKMTTTMYQWKSNQSQNPRTWKVQKKNAKMVPMNQDKRKKRLNKFNKNQNFKMPVIANGFSIRDLRIIV